MGFLTFASVHLMDSGSLYVTIISLLFKLVVELDLSNIGQYLENLLELWFPPFICCYEHELGAYLGVSLGFKSNSMGTSKADSLLSIIILYGNTILRKLKKCESAIVITRWRYCE